MSPVTSSNTPNSSSLLSKLHLSNLFSKYLFEFFIVFLGVYLAFLFTDYQDALREKKIRIKYYSALISEFQGFNRHLQSEGKKLNLAMETVEQIKSGKQPKIELTDFYYLYNGIAVRTAFNSQNFEALDYGLLRSIIGGIYQLELLEKKIERINQLQQSVLLPLKTQDKPLYTVDGHLIADLTWYPQLIEDIYDTNKLLQEIVVERAIPDMERSRKELEQTPYWKLAP